MAFAVKAQLLDDTAEAFDFPRQKTMYGGRVIARGDTVYLFASQAGGGRGLVARGVVVQVDSVAKDPGFARQTPRVSLSVTRTALATRSLGRVDLKPFTDWSDGRVTTELNFKLYRQAADEVVGLTEPAAVFLDGFF